MNYYEVNFGYHVTKEQVEESWKADPQNLSGHTTSPAETDAIIYVDRFVGELLEGLCLDYRHAYSFPDGSCYKFIRSEKTADELRNLLDAKLAASDRAYNIRLDTIIVKSHDADPWKVGYATLVDFFEGKRTADV